MDALDGIRNLVGFWKPKGLEGVSDARREGAFVTRESAVTFPVSSGIITVIWRVLQAIDPSSTLLKSLIIPLVLSFLLGTAFFLLDISDPKNTERSANALGWKLLLAIVNSFFLAAAALGLDTAISGGQTP